MKSNSEIPLRFESSHPDPEFAPIYAVIGLRCNSDTPSKSRAAVVHARAPNNAERNPGNGGGAYRVK